MHHSFGLISLYSWTDVRDWVQIVSWITFIFCICSRALEMLGIRCGGSRWSCAAERKLESRRYGQYLSTVDLFWFVCSLTFFYKVCFLL